VVKGGLNSKLHAVCDGQGRAPCVYLMAGQISGFDGARTLFPNLSAAKFLLADKGYDANWFRDGLIGKGIWLCIPPKKKMSPDPRRKIPLAFEPKAA